MIKFVISQIPFYIASFTSLLLALDRIGWLERFEEDEMAAVSGALFMTSGGVSGSLEFVSEQEPAVIGIWLTFLVLVIGGLLLGYLFSRIWKRLT